MLNRVLSLLLLTSLSLGRADDNRLVAVEHFIETITIAEGDSTITFYQRFVIEGSVSVVGDSISLPDFRLDSVNGMLILEGTLRQGGVVKVSYDYLRGNIPVAVEPAVSRLPLLGMTPIGSAKTATMNNTAKFPRLPLVVDGTIFRSVGISSNSGTIMNGGLQLNLQGKLSEEMTINGVLSDQNTPIQPEGDTRTLSEIDKVFIEVKHPTVIIKAGDIDLKLRNGRYQRHDRRLEGVNFSSGGKERNTSVVVGSVRGKFRTMAFRGEDQNQGPYRLTGKEGGRRIMITAGSEKVWLNGDRLNRGESADYTIDYGQSELTFTPRHLIDSNSRVNVEFEYADFGFQRQVASAGASKKWGGEKVAVAISWVREADNISGNTFFPLTSEDRTLLATSGGSLIVRSLAVPDSSGEYVRTVNPDNPDDSIFIYSITGFDEQTYSVGFHNAGADGLYARRVTAEGRLYFEYIPESERKQHTDLYVPWKMLSAPQMQQVANITAAFKLSDQTDLSIEMAGSGLNPNRLAQGVTSSGGVAGEISISHKSELPAQLGAIAINAETRGAGSGFMSLQRESPVEFWREWNLQKKSWDSAVAGGLKRQTTQITLSHDLPERATTSFSLGRYGDVTQRSNRWQVRSSYSARYLNKLSVDFTDVQRETVGLPISQWWRGRIYTSLLPGDIHPYFRREEEMRTADMKFDESSAGIQVEKGRFHGNLGIVQRNDFRGELTSPTWLDEGESWLGEIDLKGRSGKGLNTTLVLKQRLKSFNDGRDDLNYRLARGSVKYSPKRGDTQGSFDFRLERNLYEEKIMVYDSVAYGMGQFRYDSATGLYIEDPAGHYVVFHLPSGIRTPATHLVTGIRLSKKFRNSPNALLKDVTWRFLGSTDFTGQEATATAVLTPSLSGAGINRSRLTAQTDLRYVPRKTRRRVSLKAAGQREVVAQSIQELRDRQKQELTLNWEEPLGELFTLVLDISGHFIDHNSSILSRKRMTEGWISETGVRWRRDQALQLGGDLIIGKNIGESASKSHDLTITGVQLETLMFPGRRGRIDGSLGMFNVFQNGETLSSLPPEAARGMQLGLNLRSTVTAVLNLTEELTLNLNTTYLHDAVHQNFLMFTGEVRASF